jgi:hypothetical protein
MTRTARLPHLGVEVSVSAPAFAAGEAVSIIFDDVTVGGTSSAPPGPYHDHFFVPDVAAGAHTVQVVGRTSGKRLSAQFDVAG